MKIDDFADVAELKLERDRLENVVWRCRNMNGNAVSVLMPALRVRLEREEGQEPIELELEAEVMEVESGDEEQAVIFRTEMAALAAMEKIDAALKDLGVEVEAREIELRPGPALRMAQQG